MYHRSQCRLSYCGTHPKGQKSLLGQPNRLFILDDVQEYIPQSKAVGSSIIEKSHISIPISIVIGILSPSIALALVISIIAGPYGQKGVVRIIFSRAMPLSIDTSRIKPNWMIFIPISGSITSERAVRATSTNCGWEVWMLHWIWVGWVESVIIGLSFSIWDVRYMCSASRHSIYIGLYWQAPRAFWRSRSDRLYRLRGDFDRSDNRDK